MMLDFTWHLRGSVRLPPAAEDSAILDGVEQMLKQQRKPTIERGQHSIIFEEPLWSNFWGPNWRATVIYDQGAFQIERDLEGRYLRYDLRSLHAFIFCSIVALTFFLFGSLDGDFRQGLFFAVAAFGWIYGMNILLALLRVPMLIRRTLRAS
jgi:hypothetical protein